VIKVDEDKGRTTVDVNSYVGTELVFSGTFDMYRSKTMKKAGFSNEDRN
jgi:hypothetical protein